MSFTQSVNQILHIGQGRRTILSQATSRGRWTR